MNKLGPFIARSQIGLGRVLLWDDAAVAATAAACRASGRTWIWVEGFQLAGKTSFAKLIAEALDWPWIDLDDCAHSGSVALEPLTYKAQISPEKLEASVANLVAGGRGIVSGVCLRDVLQVPRAEAFVVYLARCSDPTPEQLVWHDGFQLEEPPPSGQRWLDSDVLRYHTMLEPQNDADIVICRIDREELEG